MAQYIKQGNIFGRIGENLGKGLAEQLPKEVERGRLANSLKNLGEQKGQTPFQRFTGLVSAAHDYPQVIQSGERILNQEARGQALADYGATQNQAKPNPFTPNQTQLPPQKDKNAPSLTQEEPLAHIQEGAIPPTKEEEWAKAGKLYSENPAKFGNDPDKALSFVEADTERNILRNQAFEKKHQKLNDIQDNVVKRLENHYNKLNGGDPRVPADLYSQIEDEAIQATKSKKEGGKGLTEQQAMKEYGDKLSEADKDFTKIDEISGWGGWGVTLRPSAETLRSMTDLQNRMEKWGQTDNYAKLLISRAKITPEMGYAIAQPVNKVHGLNKFIGNLPILSSTETLAETVRHPEYIKKTLDNAPELARFVKQNENASPLAIAYELRNKGYDAQTWLQYLTDHADELNLKHKQSQQAGTPINLTYPWNDNWLRSFSGLK